MRRIFADAVYWVAVANRKDQWYANVVTVMRSLGQATLVTTEEVLDEFLAHYSGHGPTLRNLAVATVEKAKGAFGVRGIRCQFRMSHGFLLSISHQAFASLSPRLIKISLLLGTSLRGSWLDAPGRSPTRWPAIALSITATSRSRSPADAPTNDSWNAFIVCHAPTF